MPISQDQRTICTAHASEFRPPFDGEKVGIAIATMGKIPLNALRHPPENGTCGWYIWGGTELLQSPDFFQPLHVAHLEKYVQNLLPYLALAPGWRVLLAPGYVDVWFDESLLSGF